MVLGYLRMGEFGLAPVGDLLGQLEVQDVDVDVPSLDFNQEGPLDEGGELLAPLADDLKAGYFGVVVVEYL